MLKRILAILGILLVLLLVAAIAIPLLFGDKLKALAKTEMNKQLNAPSGFEDVSISFFRHFPRLSVGLDKLYITGPEKYAADTLVSAKRIDVAVNLFSLIGSGPIKVSKVVLDEPRIHAIIGKDGSVNWDIMKASEEQEVADTSSSGFNLDLQQYQIKNGLVRYEDRQGNMSASIAGLNHEGSGNFSAEQFLLATTTKADQVNFTYEGIPYLVNTKTNLDANFDINTTNSKYSFSKMKAVLNEMEINADGYFQLVNDSTYGMDIQFNTPSNDFRTILSLVPAIYTKDFASLKTSGTAAFKGFVKGRYSSVEMPAYSVEANIKEGFFQYPELPQPVQHINLDLKASNSDGQPNSLVLEIPTASLQFGKEPFSFRVLYKQPETLQYIDAAAKGNLDLGTVGQFIKLEEGTKIGGQVNADIEAKGNLNVVLQQQPGPFQAKGLIRLANIYYASKEFPQPIQNTSATIQVTNPDGVPDHTVVSIPTGHAEFGSDKIDFSLLLTQPASDPAFDASAKGGFDLSRVKQFYSFDPGTSLSGHLDADVRIKGKKSQIDKEQYDAIQSSGVVNLSQVLFKTPDYPEGLNLKAATLQFTPKDIAINNAQGSFQKTNFSATGKITNAIGYAIKDEPLSGSLSMQADNIDLNKWMGTSTEAAPEAGTNQPFAVPGNIRFTVNAAVDEVVYDKVDYKKVKGQLAIANETVTLQNLSMQALDGTIGLNGSYSTRDNKMKPAISFAYNLQNLDVAKTFKAFNTVKYIMPIGEFISGKLNSNLTLNGRLGEQMMPDLGSLTGNGAVLLVEGFLNKFKPLEMLASKLKISELEKISVKDIKQYFEFVNGKVLVKPFKVKLSDIEMEIGGMHGFDQSMDYLVNMKIPRAKLGNEANQLINGLAAELSKKGLAINPGETVNLKVNMGGSLTNPKLNYNLSQAGTSLASELENKVKDIAAEQKAKADSALNVAKQRAKDSLEVIKAEVLKEAQKELAKKLLGAKDTSAVADSGKSSAPKRAEEAAKGILNDLLKKKKKPADSTKNQ
ncbi:AsmA-like C-terminal region-containing protein [Flavihumibacter sp. CACIAM 22H1]|uniref:AsmA family protein n=1 Tax=Flavihumibacter sp. CACIAM 22H1 TaxID=1812911 RepID=UPI0007A7D412|nr:AsmA-like C-terminal region-containing protein [Flavihumibacter sp. CACIAM 22H1]KYP14477.1 MAG: hypothetical protein A1D16_21145 [Flavihumibacter sp. CACIAM 22H1]